MRCKTVRRLRDVAVEAFVVVVSLAVLSAAAATLAAVILSRMGVI